MHHGNRMASRLRPLTTSGWLVALMVLALHLTPTRLAAQPVAPNVQPVFGIGDNEFLIGGWNIAPPRTASSVADSADQSILWATDIGANVFRTRPMMSGLP